MDREEIAQMLEAIVNEITCSSCICLFADGLDEFNGRYEHLGDLIKRLIQNPNVKCCFSSRPEKEFEDDFKTSKKLRLQDLTREDIETYVESKLGKFSQIRSLPDNEEANAMKPLRDEIVDKAEGVFLWVELAVRAQILGIKNDDPLDLLYKRLSALPRDVENIYRKMLGRIDECYSEEAAWYIGMTSYSTKIDFTGGCQSLCELAIARHGLTRDLRLSKDLTATNIISRCAHVNERITTTCAGLLEVYPKKEKGFWDRIEWLSWQPEWVRSSYTGVSWTDIAVRFCHRTAKDFMESNQERKAFLDKHRSLPEDLSLLRPALYLACITLCQLRQPSMFMRKYASSLLLEASEFRKTARGDIKEHVARLNFFDSVI